MSLSDFFWGLGDLLQETFRLLQSDFWFTKVANYGFVVLGFVGLFIWLSKQAKYNSEAASDPDQIK